MGINALDFTVVVKKVTGSIGGKKDLGQKHIARYHFTVFHGYPERWE